MVFVWLNIQFTIVTQFMTALTIALMSALIWSRGWVTVKSTSYIDRHKMSRTWYVFLNKKMKFWFMTNSINQLDVQILDFEIVPGLIKRRLKIELYTHKKLKSDCTMSRNGKINYFQCEIWNMFLLVSSSPPGKVKMRNFFALIYILRSVKKALT